MLSRRLEDTLVFRQATLEDLTAILQLLREDELGQERESPEDLPAYSKAFEEISLDPNQLLMVLQKQEEIIGTCHLTIIPSLTFQGSKRMHIEAVRIEGRYRGQGFGQRMLQTVRDIALEKGCKFLELTTHKSRAEATKFYKQCGFKNTHEGMKWMIGDR